ncbi:patatin-like phospholipase family protein [Roseateles sp. DB2]|uniref:patatin-like phospholipase family protein n=1 Tax=Roseateles sp. DB2 TaxID=3453717 RepID=UPI003EF02400
MAHYRTFEQHLDPTHGPKRILSLDGGGLRGMMTVQVLKKIEQLLRERFGDPTLVLADYFDLIAGTSTGAIIAAGLAKGMSAEEIDGHYRKLGDKVFKRSFWRQGLTMEKYKAEDVAAALSEVLGGQAMKDTAFRTGLLVVTKRLDSGSTWALTNNPAARFYGPQEDPRIIPNGEYPLWQVVRASTAAPTFFAGEEIVIQSQAGAERQATAGLFIDGGVSPHNNPSLLALMVATMDGYRFGWQAGADQMLLVSVGTGKADARVDLSGRATDLAAAQALLALKNLMEDCGDLVETMMQWLSVPTPTARAIDAEMDLAGPVLGGNALFTYHRYNALFTAGWFAQAGLDLGEAVDAAYLSSMQEMDRPQNLDRLARLGAALAAKQVDAAHFPPVFDVGVRAG